MQNAASHYSRPLFSFVPIELAESKYLYHGHHIFSKALRVEEYFLKQTACGTLIVTQTVST